MNVLTTPMPVFPQNRCNWLLARRRMQPLPARMTGFFAPHRRSKAWFTILSSGTERRRRLGNQRPRRRLKARDVFRQFDMHRSGFFRRRHPHRLAYDFRNRVRRPHRLRPFRHRIEHRHDVHHLVRLLVQAMGRTLSGKHQHGSAVHVGIRDPRNEIGRARPQGPETHRRIARQPAVDLRHEGGALLVPRQHEGDRLRRLEGNHEVGVFLSRYAEYVLDALVRKALDEQIRSLHGRSLNFSAFNL